MKGQIIGLIIVIISIFLLISGLWSNLISQTSASASISAKEVQILRTIEQIEAVKIGIPYLMNYSLLQAFYEYGKSGGWKERDYKDVLRRDLSKETYPVWRIYSNRIFLPYSNRVINYIRDKTQDYTNEYFKVLNEKYKFILKVKNISLNRTPPTLQLQANISFEGEFFKIRDSISYTLSIDPMFFEMYEKSKEIFLDRDIVFEKIDEASRMMPERCKIISYETCGYYLRDSISLLEENCPKAIVRFNDSIVRLLEDVSNLDFSKFRYEIKVIDVRSLISYEITYTTGDCCDWECDEDLCWCEELTYYFTHYYYYTGAAKIYINVVTKEDFPLYDEAEEKTNRRQIVLRFSVTSSNDYNWTPIG